LNPTGWKRRLENMTWYRASSSNCYWSGQIEEGALCEPCGRQGNESEGNITWKAYAQMMEWKLNGSERAEWDCVERILVTRDR
jgi:hypothetical protein